MRMALRAFAASIATLALVSSGFAQTYLPGSVPAANRALPGTGYVSFADPVKTTAPMPPAGSALQMPQPAEYMGQNLGSDEPWVLIAPYGWIFGMKGTVGAGRLTTPVNSSVRDAIDHVSDLKGAAQLHVESGYGDVGMIADLTYLKVEPLDGRIKVESESTIAELLGFYRVYGSGSRGAGSVTADVLAGARYYRFSNSIAINAIDLTVAERTNKWIDLVVGARVGVQVLDNLGVFLRGDVGGFGIGQSSKQSCNIVTGFDYQCTESISLMGGYRWLKVDRSNGVGRNAFLLDVTFSGPFVALGFKF
jgi:opacity protein-like surface antigen